MELDMQTTTTTSTATTTEKLVSLIMHADKSHHMRTNSVI